MSLGFESPWMLALLVLLPAALVALRFTLVDSSRMQFALSALTRCVILALLVFALAGATRIKRSRDVAILVAADLSDSVSDTAREQVTTFLTRLEDRLDSSSKAGLVIFAGAPDLVAPIDSNPEFPDAIEEIAPGGVAEATNIERALTYAWQSMPSGAVNRVLLFSDGNETHGDALAAALRGATHGFQVFTLPYEADQKPEALLEDLLAPAEVRKEQSFEVTATARSVRETAATFTLYRDGFKISEREMVLQAGATALTFQETNPADGLTKYELRMSAEHDFFLDNNVVSGIAHVSGEPRVLLVEGSERDARHLARALEAEKIQVDVREGKGMPGSLEEMAAYDAILMSDVPATDVTVKQMNLLRAYVEDLGGGFVMIGGQDSFGIGGYYRTSIEDVLPVRMRSEKKKDAPTLAMMLIVDKSASMGGSKIDLAKEAAIATVELLSDRDYVGVIAFDGSPYAVVDVQSAADRARIVESIEAIEASGGTSLYPAMAMAQEMLAGTPAALKHVILLTDGHSQPGDHEGLVARMVSDRATVSSVAVGSGADGELLRNIARWGRGEHYFTEDANDIPQIFAKETMKASKSSLIEEPFQPQLVRSDQLARSIDWENAPFLFGYVVTAAKGAARVPLLTERGDPLLAHWRFGLGKCAAFTSDAKSRWAADWISWPGYGQFWSQVVRDVMRSSQARGVETTITYKGDHGRIIIDAIDDNGSFVNGLQGRIQLVKPDLGVQSLRLVQIAPGRYEAEFPIEETGSYLFKVRQDLPGATAADEDDSRIFSNYTRGLTLSYQPEYRRLSTNEEFLRRLAESTGGRFNPTIEDLFHVTEEDEVPVREKLWPWLLRATLLLFLVDVALRRLDIAGRGPFRSEPRRYG